MRSVASALCLTLLASTIPTRGAAQTQPGQNAAYVELLGSGGVWSANLERALGAFRFRVGIGAWSADDSFGAGTINYSTVPVTMSHVKGDGNHRLETGIGVTGGRRAFDSSFDGGERTRFATLTGILGYRYQKPDGRFVFRAVLTPMYGLGTVESAYPDKGFFPSLGLSFGTAF